jgi:hypothetical protein
MLSSRKGSLSRGLSSLLSHASLLAALRSTDPPSFLGGPCSSISLLAIHEGRFSQVKGFPHIGPHRPGPDGIDAPSSSGGSWSHLWAPCSQGGGFHPYHPHRGLPPPACGGLPTHFPHGGIPPPAHGGHPTHTPHGGISLPAHGGFPTHDPHPLGGGGLLFVGVYSQALAASTAEHWLTYTLPGDVSPNVPSFIYGGGVSVPPIHFCSPHAPTSVEPSLGVSNLTLHTLLHEDAWSLLASDITMSFLVPVPPIASPPTLPPAPTRILLAPQASAPDPTTGSLCLSP